MLNAEKFKDEILETLDCDCEGFGVTEDNKIIMCRADSFCCICSFLKDGFCSREAKDRWLLSEYKEPVKLSKFEFDILRNLLPFWKWITRDENEDILVFSEGKLLNGTFGYKWIPNIGGRCERLNNLFSKDLFQFIKREDKEPTLIKDILNNCEVIEND